MAMRRKLLLILFFVSQTVLAEKHEIGLTLGGLLSQDRGSTPNALHLGGGTALQANYGLRLLGDHAGLHLMLPSEADTLSMNAVLSGLTALPTRTATFIGAHSISVQAWTRNCGDGLAHAARSVTSIQEALPIIYQALQADNTMSWPAAGSC